MNIAFTDPWLLSLLFLAIVPLFSGVFNKRAIAWQYLVRPTLTTSWLDRLIKFLGVLAFVALVLGISGLYQAEKTFLRTGTGAHIVFVLDRSGSMNETFGGTVPDQQTPAKSHVARDLLVNFVDSRPHDLFGVVGFSTQPFYISPLTEQKQATRAAIDSMISPGLAFTNAAKGLGMGLNFFADQPLTGSRVIVLVSDGAAVLDHRAQRVLREWFERYRVNLYWFFLRTENGRGITSVPENPRDDNPRVMPERHLDFFFRSLNIPYQAYEVDTPESLQYAITELDQLESLPLLYEESVPRNQLSKHCFAIALFLVMLLTAIKMLEAKNDSSST